MSANPLKYRWKFYGHTVDKSKNFEANQLELASFDTVEDFWTMWYSTAKPSQLFATRDWRKEPTRTAPVSAICMFKDGIEPKWEDPANMNGGQWYCQVQSWPPDSGQRSRFCLVLAFDLLLHSLLLLFLHLLVFLCPLLAAELGRICDGQELGRLGARADFWH